MEKLTKHTEKALEKGTAVLKDWGIYQDYSGDRLRLKGYVYDDSQKRFADGTYITTSHVKDIDLKRGIVATRNTIYYLK